MGRARDNGQERERWEALGRFQGLLELPMIILGLAWAVLLVIELYAGPDPVLVTLSTTIWVIFAVDFFFELAIAPSKGRYLKTNFLTALSLLAPAFRVLRAARLFRAAKVARMTRGMSLLRIVGSANRSMAILKGLLARWGFGYVIASSALVVLLGAAGMYAFERGSPGFGTFGESLWWSAMILTTMGTQYWPETPEGRILCFMLALYSFTVFGYVTAYLATFLIGADEKRQSSGKLMEELARLREEISKLRQGKGGD